MRRHPRRPFIAILHVAAGLWLALSGPALAMHVESPAESVGLEELTQTLDGSAMEQAFDRALRAVFEAGRDVSRPMGDLRDQPLFPSRTGRMVAAAQEAIRQGTFREVRFSQGRYDDNAFFLLQHLMLQEPSAWEALQAFMVDEPESSPRAGQARVAVLRGLQREIDAADIEVRPISRDLTAALVRAVSEGRLYLSVLERVARFLAIHTGGPEQLARLLHTQQDLNDNAVKALVRALAWKRPKLLVNVLREETTEVSRDRLGILAQELLREDARALHSLLRDRHLPIQSVEAVVGAAAAEKDGPKRLKALLNGGTGLSPRAAHTIRHTLAARAGLEEGPGMPMTRAQFLKFLGAAIASGEQTIQEFGKLAERRAALPPSWAPHQDSLLTFVRKNGWVDPLFDFRKIKVNDLALRDQIGIAEDSGIPKHYTLEQQERVLDLAPEVIVQQEESMREALSIGRETLEALGLPEARKPLLERVRQHVPNLSGIPDDQLASGLVWAVQEEMREAKKDYSWIVKDWHRYSGQLERAIAREITSQTIVGRKARYNAAGRGSENLEPAPRALSPAMIADILEQLDLLYDMRDGYSAMDRPVPPWIEWEIYGRQQMIEESRRAAGLEETAGLPEGARDSELRPAEILGHYGGYLAQLDGPGLAREVQMILAMPGREALLRERLSDPRWLEQAKRLAARLHRPVIRAEAYLDFQGRGLLREFLLAAAAVSADAGRAGFEESPNAASPLPNTPHEMQPLGERRARRVVEEAAATAMEADGTWHVLSPETIRAYPALAPLVDAAVQGRSRLILDDGSHNRAVRQLREVSVPIETIRYYGTDAEITSFQECVRGQLDTDDVTHRVEPVPLTSQSFEAFLQQLLPPAAGATPIDYNQLAAALTTLLAAA